MAVDNSDSRTSFRSEEQASDQNGPENYFWIERIARKLGFDRIGEMLFGRPDVAAYIFLSTILFIQIPLFITLNYYLTGFFDPFQLPGRIVIIVGLLYGLWAMRRLRDKYENAVQGIVNDESAEYFEQELSKPAQLLLRFATSSGKLDSPDQTLTELSSPVFKGTILLILWITYAIWLWFNPAGIQGFFVNRHPVLVAISIFGIIPFIYYLLFAEFLSLYASIVLLLPLKIRSIGYINFQDEFGYGNLKFIGDLAKSATIYYFIGVAAYFILQVFSEAFGRVDVVGYVIWNAIGISIAIGVALFFLPIITIHSHMKHAKHQKIRQIADQIKNKGPSGDTEMFPDTKVPSSIDEGQEYFHLYIKMRRVESNHEYPLDMSHIQELVLGAIIPYIAHVTVSYLIKVTNAGH
ncbi:MAG: hypothetical protein ABEI06_00580 [Halobacteriaceae archaeon]